ncbi:MAG TPA: aminotransferase class I/II-fold pyridoxal phosphate-dependent enzyme, partial [Candidatus Eremiobacteraceae bacterium]|nr:aminotransferase class I/II-fold pyridoxal phosphate-dependent enzyme [Candidatus Eremiobacteraceae bacterium]
MNPRRLRAETIAVHAASRVDAATGAIVPPIVLSTTFERDPDGGYPRGFSYQRKSNPNREELEAALTALEGGAGAAAFASGSAAATALFLTLEPGAHVIGPTQAYYGIRVILRDCFQAWGVEVTLVDTSDPENVRRALRRSTRVVWVESPTNPLLEIADVAAIARIAHDAGALCVCDATLPTPILQRSLELGADFALHATTKYLGGHSDVIGGALVAKHDGPHLARVRHLQHVLGAVPSPFDCWLVARGIRTLPYRMRAHSANALLVAQWLASHER